MRTESISSTPEVARGRTAVGAWLRAAAQEALGGMVAAEGARHSQKGAPRRMEGRAGAGPHRMEVLHKVAGEAERVLEGMKEKVQALTAAARSRPGAGLPD